MQFIKSDQYGFYETTVGIDIGSRAAKGALVHKGRLYLSSAYTGVNMQTTAEEVLHDLLLQAEIEPRDISYLVGTGYGRVALSFSGFPVKMQTEIFCHALGAHVLNPEVRTVIDIGGQDSKVITVNADGEVTDFVMNDKCAAGTGRFLEKAAEMLSLPLEALGQVSLQSAKLLNISNQCSVFAESELISMLARGEYVADIAAGIHRAVTKRVLSLSRRLDPKQQIMFTGGVSQNIGMRKALEDVLQCRLAESEINPYYAGAIGGAALALRYLKQEKSLKKQLILASVKSDFQDLHHKIEQKLHSYIDGGENRKKIGYLCTYTPMELMHAADVSYIRLFQAGTAEEIAGGEQITRSFYCDFIKSILGAFREKDPLYLSLDGVYNFYTCDCTKRLSEAILNYFKDADTFVLPRKRHNPDSYQFLADELHFFAQTLEGLTGTRIDPRRLRESIRLYNRIRTILKNISGLRKQNPPLLSGGEFYDLMRGYFYLEPEQYLSICQDFWKQRQSRSVPNVDSGHNGSRIFLSGGLQSDGDMRLIDLLENELNARIVAEDHCTGLRAICYETDETAEPYAALAKAYMDKAPCARMQPLEDSLDFSVELAKEYNAEAVVFAYVKFCPCYGQIKNEFVKRFQKAGFPVLDIGLDYSRNDYGQLRTRLETFINMINGPER
ncbi:Activator of (R)-2-hydroxyglutaryl-CoA dehydratase [Pelotomaculum schinkii]|uniref:Activator of (R)-2-hydroxyglutaryl-CoA dehydratase n=1 Tax=Pelotomaculum schinkii TaxID=78350 RepID=A0A4Y7RHV7_9FIRM|nr:2-hydroxyacyl-CoA dehydratase [Pelotomaculum schinkii]TEB08396.1 Activator of (R)-2-hydroxyglutaryl-CoA dehydratase [Pelotomaculum schinkii]